MARNSLRRLIAARVGDASTAAAANTRALSSSLTALLRFNGEHNAGIQVLNTSNFPALEGPLKQLVP
jgi:hypothetical protein